MIWLFLLFLLLKNPILAIDSTASATILINKFQFNPPLDNNEWVELYNTTDKEINLNDWYLADESNTKKLLTGKVIAAKSYFIFDNVKNWLNNDFDTVFLKIGESIVDEIKYKITGKKISINNILMTDEYSDYKGKWLGRTTDGGNEWQIFVDKSGPIGGNIFYFNGYKTILENIEIGITEATDKSGIGTTEIIKYESKLENNNCIKFDLLQIGSSFTDGRCYKFEYLSTDGVGNSSVFTSDSIVKFDFSKPELLLKAFRNIKFLKSEFNGIDTESGIRGYKYIVNNLDCGSTFVPNNWSYIDNSILDIEYINNPLSIFGKSINNAGIESDIGCINFIIDLTKPKIIKQINPDNGKYKIGDKLIFSLNYDEDIEIFGNTFEIKLNVKNAKFLNKTGNILNFEYEVVDGDFIDNLDIKDNKIILNNSKIFDLSGNEADLSINNIDSGIEIDGVIPLIRLIGESYVEIPQFQNYIDLGVTVSDGSILTTNNVNILIGGSYEINYKVTDEAGNENFIVRTVKVIDSTAPIINQLSINNYELNIESNEEGYIEWSGKCNGENNNIVAGDNLIKIKNNGDGVYDNCKIRAWDKWGNVNDWQTVNSFTIDTTPPIINFNLPTLENESIINESYTEISILSNEKLKSCLLEKEKLVSGDFETGNVDGWNGNWISDNLHFVSGNWSIKSPNLNNEQLTEKSIWQTINMESDGELSFWWRVSSEKDWDFLKFYVDGTLLNKISGEVDWQEIKQYLDKGEHVIKFTYSKDYSGNSGEDAGWIDNVNIKGGGSILSMNIIDNLALVKLNNLVSGSNKYKIKCFDLYDNQSETIERKIIKNIEKNNEDNLPIPTPYTIFKTTVNIPTLKNIKPTILKTNIKKLPSVLGMVTTPTINLSITPTPEMGTKLKNNTPWEEIKFWLMGMMALGTTSGVILLDKKFI